MTAFCEICGRPFQPQRPWGRFCSAACRGVGYRRALKDPVHAFRTHPMRSDASYPTKGTAIPENASADEVLGIPQFLPRRRD